MIQISLHKVLRLRKNLHGVMNAASKDTNDLGEIIDGFERILVEHISSRYAAIQISDLATSNQLTAARLIYYLPGEVEIDEDALVSVDPTDPNSLWVQAWVCVSKL